MAADDGAWALAAAALRPVLLQACAPLDYVVESVGLGAAQPDAPLANLKLAVCFVCVAVAAVLAATEGARLLGPGRAAPIYFRRTSGPDVGKVEPLAEVCASLRLPLPLPLLQLQLPLLLPPLLLLPLPLSCYCRRRRRYCATHGYRPLRTTHRHPRRTRDASTTASTASPSISPSRGESSTSRAARSSTGRPAAATTRWLGRTLGERLAL
jgi:hypothetical protein